MSRTVTVGSVYRTQLSVLEPDGVTKVTGQEAGDFTLTLWRNNVKYTATAPTISEVAGSPGEYAVAFTVPSAGYWKMEALISYNSQLWAVHFDAAVEGGGGSGGSNDLHLEPVDAVLGHQVLLAFYEEDEGVPETGLELADYTLVATANGQVVDSAATTLGLVFSEVDDTEAAGEYRLAVTPHVEGLIVVRLDRGTRRIRWAVRTSRRGLIDLIAAMEGGVTQVPVTPCN